MSCKLDPEPEHLLTQDPHPNGNPEHLPVGREQEPWDISLLTWHEFFKHLYSHVGQSQGFPVKYISKGQFGIYIFLLFL